MNRLNGNLSQFLFNIQDTLFPWLEDELGPMTAKQQELVTTLELVRIETFVGSRRGYPGRPAQDRSAIARTYVAKMVYNMTTTRMLLDRLATDVTLRRISGWKRLCEVPNESTFSRAFGKRPAPPSIVYVEMMD